MKRTVKQSKSLHLWCSMLAESLNDAGLTVEKTLTGKAEIPWEMETVKRILFKQIMKAQTGKTSTRDLTTKQLSEVAETLMRYLAEQHSLSVDFPSLESLSNQKLAEQ